MGVFLKVAALVLFIIAAIIPYWRLTPSGLACWVASEVVPS